MLKHLNECFRDGVKMLAKVELRACRRVRIEVGIELVALRCANLSHECMLEHARQSKAFPRPLPVFCRLRDQEMKESVIGRRNRSSQAGLPGPLRFALCQMPRLLEQVFRKGHSRHAQVGS